MIPDDIVKSVIWLLVVFSIAFGHDVTKSEVKLNRHKRFLVYTNGGTFKLVIGIAIPVKLGQKQSMACGWNFQFQYAEPKTANDTKIYPPIIGRSKERRSTNADDRSLAYMGIEYILNRAGLNGRACLLRSICENAVESAHHEANGLYGHLLHIALTPDYGDGLTDPDLDPVYFEAQTAGKFGVDCTSLYADCQHENALLDAVSLFDN